MEKKNNKNAFDKMGAKIFTSNELEDAKDLTHKVSGLVNNSISFQTSTLLNQYEKNLKGYYRQPLPNDDKLRFGALAGVASGGSTLPVTAAVMGKNFLVSRASNTMFTNPETLKFLTRSVKGEPDKQVVGAMKKFIRTARDEATKAILRQYLQSIGETD